MMKNVTTVSNTMSTVAMKSPFKPGVSNKTFSQVFAQKKLQTPPSLKVPIAPMGPTASAFKNILNNMVINHETAVSSIKKAMVTTEHSPEKLLKIQFKTGALFLREQMFCRVAELFTNTLKNFTQMQV